MWHLLSVCLKRKYRDTGGRTMRKCGEAAFVSTEGNQRRPRERPEREEQLIGRESRALLANSPQSFDAGAQNFR